MLPRDCEIEFRRGFLLFEGQYWDSSEELLVTRICADKHDEGRGFSRSICKWKEVLSILSSRKHWYQSRKPTEAHPISRINTP